jgi:hypothetical protein
MNKFRRKEKAGIIQALKEVQLEEADEPSTAPRPH